jgi:hypothetical protein
MWYARQEEIYSTHRPTIFHSGPTSVHASRCLLYSIGMPLIVTLTAWLTVTLELVFIVTVMFAPALRFVFTCMPRPPYVGVMGLMLGVGRRPFRVGVPERCRLRAPAMNSSPYGPRPVPAPQEEPYSYSSQALGPCRVGNITTNLGRSISHTL